MASVRDISTNPWGTDPLLTEREYRLARFGTVVPRLVGRRVALYGTGVNALDVLEHYRDELEIGALVDDARAGETCSDLPVVGCGELAAHQIDVVVIAAKATSELVIARRISDACQKAGVALIDMYGNDVCALQRDVCPHDVGDMLCLLEGYDILCVSMDAVLDYGLGTWAREMAKVEYAFKAVHRLIERAHAWGLRVVALAEAWARPWESCLPCDAVDEVLWTDELGCTKENGLYRIVSARYPQERILCVGTDLDRDVLMARIAGLDALLVTTTGGPLVAMPCAKGRDVSLPDAVTSADCALLTAVDAFDAEKGRSDGNPFWAYGYRALGPLVLGYVTWLAQNVLAEGLDGILFPARDGWLLQQVYERYRASVPSLALPPSHYLLTSRKAALRSVLDDTRFVDLLPQTCPGLRPSEMLRSVAGLSEDSISVDEGHDEDTCADRLRAVRTHADALADVGRTTRAGLLRYLDECGIMPEGRYAFTEFVALGTTQFLLETVVPCRLQGYYIDQWAHWVGRYATQGSSPLAYCAGRSAVLREHYLELEIFMSSPDPSLDGYDELGRPLYGVDRRMEDERIQMDQVQKGVLALVDAFLAVSETGGDLISPELAAALFDRCDIPTHPSMPFDDLRVQPIVPMGETLRTPQASVEVEASRTLRTEIEVLMDLLAAFDRVCCDHGLRYIAIHGTLLGAVRDGGPIPWDHDLDVAMPRADYDRLVQLAAEGVFAAPYFLQTPENDVGYFTGGYARLRDSSTAAIEPGIEWSTANQGMWMDIMPLDDCPVSDAAVNRRQRWIRTWQRVLYAKTFGFNIRYLWDIDPRKLSAYFVLGDHLSRSWLVHQLRRCCTSEKPTGLLTVFCANYRSTDNTMRMRADDVAAAHRVPFGETTIPIPRHAEEWLEWRYGPTWNVAKKPSTAPKDFGLISDPNTPYKVLIARMKEGTHA